MNIEKFNSAAYFKEKYGRKRLRYFTEREYSVRLNRIVNSIHTATLGAWEADKKIGIRKRTMVGAFIVGSYARGDAHADSDLDLYTIVTDDPWTLFDDFMRILRRGIPNIKIEWYQHIDYTNPDSVAEFLHDEFAVTHDYLLVSPYPDQKTNRTYY